jgi:hypothetical protein
MNWLKIFLTTSSAALAAQVGIAIYSVSTQADCPASAIPISSQINALSPILSQTSISAQEIANEPSQFSAADKDVLQFTTWDPDKIREVKERPGFKSYGMSDLELLCIIAYTEARYYSVNEDLRSGDTTFGPYVKKLVGAISKLPTYKGVVYRGMTSHAGFNFDDYQVGKKVSDLAFLSTSAISSIADQYSIGRLSPNDELFQRGYTTGAAKLIMHSNTGHSIEAYTDHPDESEVLFAPNTSFTVTKRTMKMVNGRPFYTIEMQEN